jgi:hypothetical protein
MEVCRAACWRVRGFLSKTTAARQPTKTFQRLRGLFWERRHRTGRCCGMEDIAMLLFYLPVIMFAAMFETKKDKREAEVDGN